MGCAANKICAKPPRAQTIQRQNRHTYVVVRVLLARSTYATSKRNGRAPPTSGASPQCGGPRGGSSWRRAARHRNPGTGATPDGLSAADDDRIAMLLARLCDCWHAAGCRFAVLLLLACCAAGLLLTAHACRCHSCCCCCCWQARGSVLTPGPEVPAGRGWRLAWALQDTGKAQDTRKTPVRHPQDTRETPAHPQDTRKTPARHP